MGQITHATAIGQGADSRNDSVAIGYGARAEENAVATPTLPI
jgi:hypothetical protein